MNEAKRKKSATSGFSCSDVSEYHTEGVNITHTSCPKKILLNFARKSIKKRYVFLRVFFIFIFIELSSKIPITMRSIGVNRVYTVRAREKPETQ